MNRSELHKRLADEPAYREKQILESIYSGRAKNWDEITSIPSALREKLRDLPFSFEPVNRVVILTEQLNLSLKCPTVR